MRSFVLSCIALSFNCLSILLIRSIILFFLPWISDVSPFISLSTISCSSLTSFSFSWYFGNAVTSIVAFFASSFSIFSILTFVSFNFVSISAISIFIFSIVSVFSLILELIACPSVFIAFCSTFLWLLKLFSNCFLISSIFSVSYSLLQVGHTNESGSNSSFVLLISSHFLYNSFFLLLSCSIFSCLSSNSCLLFLNILSFKALSFISFIFSATYCCLFSFSSVIFNSFNSFFAFASLSAFSIFSFALACISNISVSIFFNSWLYVSFCFSNSS